MKNEKRTRKKILSQIKYWPLYVVLSFIVAIVIQLMTILPPIFMEKVIDEYVPTKNIEKIGLGVLIFVGVPVLSSIISTLYNYFINVVGRHSGQKLSMMAFEKLIHQPLSYFNDSKSSELATYCRGESNKYVMLWLYDIPIATACIFSGLFIFCLMFKFSNILAWIIILIIPFAILPSIVISKKLDKYVKKLIENNAKISQVMEDSFRGIKLIKSLSLENERIKKINRINDKIVTIWSKIAALDNLNGTWVNGFAINLFTGIVFLVSVWLIIKNRMSIGMLVVIFSYLPKVFSIVSNVTAINFSFKKQLAEFDKLFSIINMDDEWQNNGNVKFKFDNKLEFDNVSFAYSEERGEVLKNLTFSVKKNQWVGIVGKSGVGKSTIFDLLLRFYDCSNGEILVDGINISSFDIRDLRKNIALVSQEAFLFPGTILENLVIANISASQNEIENVIKEVGLSNFVAKLPKGLNTEIGENGVQLSGGERQRLSLAQGILRKSEILLLDEVTANIDATTEGEIKETIKKIMASRNLTVIAISHKLEFLENVDYILQMENGTLCNNGI